MNGCPTWLQLVTAPANDPVTTAEVKNYLKMHEDITADDSLIGDMIKGGTDEVERYLNRKLINQTWKMTIDGQPDPINFPFGWLQSITSIVTVAEDDTTTDESAKIHTQTGEDGRVWLKNGTVYATTTRDYGKMVINWVAGYGAAAANVPKKIKIGIYQVIAEYYRTREWDVPNDVKKMLSDYRIHAFKP
jgi:uncharacterized phiE125 gp8 family phage protein